MSLTDSIYICGLGMIVLMAVGVLVIIRQFRGNDGLKKRTWGKKDF